MEVNMSWIKLTDVSGNRICVNTDKVEQIKERMYNEIERRYLDKEKGVEIFFSNDSIEMVKESYDFVLSQLEM